MTRPIVTLAPGRERSVLRRHPWIFRGAIADVSGAPESGQSVLVRAQDGRELGTGAWSPDSQIAVRMWSGEPGIEIDEAFFCRRLEAARELRASLPSLADCDGWRVAHAEADGLPGITVDRYGSTAVVQLTSAGAERHRAAIAVALQQTLDVERVFERSDGGGRAKEGLPERVGPLLGGDPPETIEIVEHGRRHLVDVVRGHKTGFYLDQRDARDVAERELAGAEVLNAFSYTGAFAIAALRGGAAHVTNVDSSGEALELAERVLALNGLDESRYEQIDGDLFKLLRGYRDARKSFDAIVLDPPKFAESKAQVPRAARGYKDINLLALKLLRPGGRLLTFSCSGHIDPTFFQKIVADSAIDAGRDVRLVGSFSQAADHPVLATFPEGRYLCGLLACVE